jgi:hypothetical protein|tara:strand:- start:39 stop:290 length:252 start_codon:yes stop_codon:yes gene_type:complete
VIPINTIKIDGWPEMSAHAGVPKIIAEKYPQMNFTGKSFYLKGYDWKRFVRAKYRCPWIQREVGECFYYSFKDDFFWFSTDFK